MSDDFVEAAFPDQLASEVFRSCSDKPTDALPVGVAVYETYLTKTLTSHVSHASFLTLTLSLPVSTAAAHTVPYLINPTSMPPSEIVPAYTVSLLAHPSSSQILSQPFSTSSKTACALWPFPCSIPTVSILPAPVTPDSVVTDSIDLSTLPVTSVARTTVTTSYQLASPISTFATTASSPRSEGSVSQSTLTEASPPKTSLSPIGKDTTTDSFPSEHAPSLMLTTAMVYPTRLTINSQIITQGSQSEYMVDGETLTPGSIFTITADSTVKAIALKSADGQTVIVVGHVTSTLLPSPVSSDHPAAVALLTFDATTYTANSESDYIIAGQTLRPGGSAITVSNTPLSLITQGSEVIIGGTTTIAETIGLGGYIMSGFGLNPTSTVVAQASSVGNVNGTSLFTFKNNGKKSVDDFFTFLPIGMWCLTVFLGLAYA